MGIIAALLMFLNGQPAATQPQDQPQGQVHILLGGFPTIPPVHN
jgi:hypothetical protein